MLPFVFFPDGTTSLKERIARADVVAKVRLQTVVAGSERWQIVGYTAPLHVGTLEHRFTALEYLKGTGGSEIGVVVFEGGVGRETEALAVADGATMLADRDARWDSRDAIVFLQTDHSSLTDFPSAGRHILGSIELDWGDAGDAYSISSYWDKTWLPSDAGAAGAARTAGTADDQRFLLDEPPARSAARSGAGSAAQSGAAPTITLAAMKTEVDAIRREVAAGDGSDAYRVCIYEKYKWEREIAHVKAGRNGGYFYKRYDASIGSGQPAGILTHTIYGLPLPEGDVPVTGEMRVIGRDRDLFVPSWPGAAHTARPLLAGEYRFYFSYLPQRFIPCNAHPEEEQKRDEVFVAVTAPSGTLHEALFDPAAIGTGVGADAANGVVEPAAFTVGGAATTITGLKWESGVVTMQLSPAASLSGYDIDVIELDGSVSLTLSAAGAASNAGGTLTWNVADQPWHAGDQLMLRLRTAGSPSATATPTPAPTATPEPTATPTPEPTVAPSEAGVTVTLSPRPLEGTNFNYVNMTIEWADPSGCQGQYFVAIHRSEELDYVIRLLGFHPAPGTTTLTYESGWGWGYFSTNDHWVEVSCDPSDGSPRTLVGKASLQAAMPSDSDNG